MSMKKMMEKIVTKKAKIGVIGLGYVGLPLAVAFAEAGFKVVGLESSPKRKNMVNAGESYINDVSTSSLVKVVKDKKLVAANDYEDLKTVDIICICVPTPLDKNKQPDMSYVQSTALSLAKIIRQNQLVVLESTTYPGTTEELLRPALETSGLIVGKDIYLAFSPERVDPGNKLFKTVNVPKVVGGVTPKCTKLTETLYRQIISSVYHVSSPRVAEMEKLLENIFRSVNIALVNEMAILCKRMKIDIWEVIEAAKTKPYGYMPFYPGPGLGGHCIPLDPFYLSWKAKEYDLHTKFIELAGEINDRMPEYVVSLIQDGLNDAGLSLKKVNVLVLGVAYKKDIDDIRESPSLKIIALLKNKGANVQYNDPYVPKLNVAGQILKSCDISSAKLTEFGCVIIATDHSSYNYDDIFKYSNIVIDTRNASALLKHQPKATVIKI